MLRSLDRPQYNERDPPLSPPPDFQVSAGGFFIENRGQLEDESAFFYSMGTPLSIVLGNGYIGYMLENSSRDPENVGTFVRASFKGANPVEPIGIGEMGSRTNFFIGRDPREWITGALSFSEVLYRNLWDGIDLRYYYSNGNMKYEIIVHPSGVLKDVLIGLEGHERLTIRADGLCIETGTGVIEDTSLEVFYQDSVETKIDARFTIIGKNAYSFAIGEHDPERTIVIDPLVYSTYLGGSHYQSGNSITVDEEGCAYITGNTSSRDFPTIPGSFNTTFVGRSYGMAYVTKLNPQGTSLVYSTYLGGSGNDVGHDIKVIVDGTVIVTGSTYSEDFPVTEEIYQRELDKGADIFITKLSNDGSELIFSTYLGGDGVDIPMEIALDPQGFIHLTGYTSSEDFPMESSAFQTWHSGRPYCVFVAKMTPNGTTLVASTYLGGWKYDSGHGIDLDPDGNIYVCGKAESINFPTTEGVVQPEFGGNRADGFVACFSPDLTSARYITYLDGEGYGVCRDIDVDDEGNAYVTGYTNSEDFPTTSGAYQMRISSKSIEFKPEAFVCKLSPDGSKFIFSTLVGGNDWDSASSISVDEHGYSYVIGRTLSNDFPVTPGLVHRFRGKNASDAFMFKLNSAGSDLDFSTCIGGTRRDDGTCLVMDDEGMAYITGTTVSDDFPTTEGVFLSDIPGMASTIVAKVDPRPSVNPINFSDGPVLYAGYKHYRFVVNGNPTQRKSLPDRVSLQLDPDEADVEVIWFNGDMNHWLVSDPNDLVNISWDVDVNERERNVTLRFDIMFNWTWPHENLCYVYLITEWSNSDKEVYQYLRRIP